MNILVIDSGIAPHRDLQNVSIAATGFRGQNDLDTVTDETGHGTAVTALIAKGRRNFCVFVLKLFNRDDECTIDDLIAALEYAVADNRYDVINMSFGITGYQNPPQIAALETLCRVLCEQGSVLTAAFDNDGEISYPACFDSVVGVNASPVARLRMEYEYLTGSPVNMRAYGASQRVAWINPAYTFIGGTSFACANAANVIVGMLQEDK